MDDGYPRNFRISAFTDFASSVSRENRRVAGQAPDSISGFHVRKQAPILRSVFECDWVTLRVAHRDLSVDFPNQIADANSPDVDVSNLAKECRELVSDEREIGFD